MKLLVALLAFSLVLAAQVRDVVRFYNGDGYVAIVAPYTDATAPLPDGTTVAAAHGAMIVVTTQDNSIRAYEVSATLKLDDGSTVNSHVIFQRDCDAGRTTKKLNTAQSPVTKISDVVVIALRATPEDSAKLLCRALR